MNFTRYKILGLQVLLINQLFLADLYQPKTILADDNINKILIEYSRNIPDNKFYMLGPGDVLRLKVKDEKTPDLNITFTIDGEGIATLKRLKRVYVNGLTIAELTKILNHEYSKYVKEPEVELLLINYRPISVFVEGEVAEPGMYRLQGYFNPLASEINTDNTINPQGSNKNKPVEIRPSNTLKDNFFFPSMIDAIRKSGGVTIYSDLKNIKITRINSITKGGGRIETKIDLIESLRTRDMTKNIRILDGDTIFIPKSDKPLISQISTAITATLNPRFINVYVGGRVEQPGITKVNRSSVLADAIDIGGGAKALRGGVRFLRYNNDGSIDRRKFSFNPTAPQGSYENPFLKNGDVIFVGKSVLNVTTEVLTEITAPLQGIFTTYGLIKVFREN